MCMPNLSALMTLCAALTALVSACAGAEEENLKLSKEKSFQESDDFCLILGWYGDGHCDLTCDQPDRDCELTEADPSLQPPYSAEGDVCAELGYYGDGQCDATCAQPDPDCAVSGYTPPPNDTGYTDYEYEGTGDEFYSDGSGSTASVTPQDPCVVTWDFDDGYCDPFCLEMDPDCADDSIDYENPSFGVSTSDPCEELGWYGNGVCDITCAYPDPDCDAPAQPQDQSGTWPQDQSGADQSGSQPDGAQGDLCERLGYYYDGECDVFCDQPDPDCE